MGVAPAGPGTKLDAGPSHRSMTAEQSSDPSSAGLPHMVAAKRAGRIIGTLILIQMIVGGLVNFTLEAPLFGTPGFLVSAAPHSQQIGLAAVLGLATEALWVAVAITAFPIVWPRARAMALWLLALAAVVLAAAVIENVGVMSLVSFSEAYAKAPAAGREQLEAVRVIVSSARNWAHYMARIADGVTIFVFYAALLRFALVPRVIAGFGLVAVVAMLTSVGMPIFGHDVVFPMLAPLGLSQLALALWLIAKGFRDQARPAVDR
jgi:hypothetical protein